MSTQRGFTLVETLLALFIVAAALAGMVQLAALSRRANSLARSATMATVLAAEKMEELRSSGAAQATLERWVAASAAL